MGTTSKEVKDNIAMHLTTIVSEAIDYFEASGERIDEAVEKFNRARTDILMAMRESNEMTPGNPVAVKLYEACGFIENGIELLTGVKA
jgi:ribosomal protein S18 acetylase RimI-like enzyme